MASRNVLRARVCRAAIEGERKGKTNLRAKIYKQVRVQPVGSEDNGYIDFYISVIMIFYLNSVSKNISILPNTRLLPTNKTSIVHVSMYTRMDY